MNTGADSDPASTKAFEEALGQLSDADYRRLYQIARNRAKCLHNIGYEDLLHIAIERGLAGSRPWPSGVNLFAFLAEVMRSIADEYLKRQQRRVKDRVIDGSDGQLPTAKPQSTPDSIYYAKRTLEDIEAFFADDEEAWMIVAARADGHKASVIRAEFDLTPQQYEAASKRIQRNLPRLGEVNDD